MPNIDLLRCEDDPESTDQDLHKDRLRQKFRPLVMSTGISAAEEQLLLKYGRWLEGLMLGELTPISEAQNRFILVCNHELEPQTPYELAWVNYLKMVPGDYRFYLRARSMLERLPPHDYKRSRRLHEWLARKGHEPSIEWLIAEGPWQDVPSTGRGVSSWDTGAIYGASTMYTSGGNEFNHSK